MVFLLLFAGSRFTKMVSRTDITTRTDHLKDYYSFDHELTS